MASQAFRWPFVPQRKPNYKILVWIYASHSCKRYSALRIWFWLIPNLSQPKTLKGKHQHTWAKLKLNHWEAAIHVSQRWLTHRYSQHDEIRPGWSWNFVYQSHESDFAQIGRCPVNHNQALFPWIKKKPFPHIERQIMRTMWMYGWFFFKEIPFLPEELDMQKHICCAVAK